MQRDNARHNVDPEEHYILNIQHSVETGFEAGQGYKIAAAVEGTDGNNQKRTAPLH